MPGGTLTLRWGSNSIEIGTVITINESMQKSCTVVPLVNMSVDDTFAVESRSSKTINISFKRNNSDWTQNNSTWITRMTAAVNRWQCRTDGFKLIYEADSDNPYIAEINMNGYVKSFIYRYASGNPEVIEGSLEFHVGTMYCDQSINDRVESRAQTEFYVSITDSRGAASYTLVDGIDTTCIESYTLCGGPESPFEYLSMTIPRNRLAEVAPALVAEDGIVAGRNRVTVRAIGTSNMTVTKCKQSNNKYTITAYCDADRLRGYTTWGPISGTPEYIVNSILKDTHYGAPFSDEAIVMEHEPYTGDNLSFPQGRNVWYVLQVAAMCMGCKIFFANNHAYVVDLRSQNSSEIDDVGAIDLFPSSGNVSAAINDVSLGDEGIDTIVNKVQMRVKVAATDDEGNPLYTQDPVTGEYHVTLTSGTVTYPSGEETSASINAYSERTSSLLPLDDLTQYDDIKAEVEIQNPEDPEGDPIIQEMTIIRASNQAKIFAQNYISYRDEPQQSISFTMKEMHSDSSRGPVWAPSFLPIARASSIEDDVDSVVITNKSDLGSGVKPQKLCMSTYEMHYPKGTTTYTFGVMASIDLSSSTSQITTALDNS